MEFLLFVIVGVVLCSILFAVSRANVRLFSGMAASLRAFVDSRLAELTGYVHPLEMIEIQVDGITGVVDSSTTREDGKLRTRVQFAWSPPGSLHLARNAFQVRVRERLAGQEIQVGEAAFDRRYRIRGEPEGWVRQVLNEHVRTQVGLIAALGLGTVRIDIGHTGISIEVPRKLSGALADLQVFQDASISILRRIRDVSAGLDALPAAEEIVASGHCPVCAQPLAEPLHRCARCRTAHHRECWEYFGACAIYGCARGPASAPPSDGKPG